MTEEEVYLGTKNYLLKLGYTILAGQPPRGVDHLPVIEIKENTGERGSKFSYKPDLVAFKNNTFIIIECKPSFNYDDYLKLKNVVNNDIRLKCFYEELKQYSLFDKLNYNHTFEQFKINIKISLAYSGKINEDYKDINHICVDDWKGNAISTL